MASKRGTLTFPIYTEGGLEIVEIINEGNNLFAIFKVPIEDMYNLKIQKTDKKRRLQQKTTQKKYRERKRLPQHRKNKNQVEERSIKE